MRVADWMKRAPRTIAEDDRLDHARALMDEGGFRHLPVVDAAGRLVGILSDRDLRAHHGHLHDTRVTGAMVEGPVTVDAETPIEVAAELVLARKIGCLPVLGREGQLVGVLTETDLLRGLLGWQPGEEGSTSHVDVELDAPTETLAELMALLEIEDNRVLSLRRLVNGSKGRRFRLQLDARDPAYAIALLREHGFATWPVRPARAAGAPRPHGGVFPGPGIVPAPRPRT